MTKIIIAVLASIILLACTSGSKLHFTKLEEGGDKILYGEIDREILFAEFPDWLTEYDKYLPDTKTIDSLKHLPIKCSVEIFMGTWCQDSKREVPRFYKILDQCNSIPFKEVKLWAVDRTKKLPESRLTDEKGIHFVATFIFIENENENENEIGRIVEQSSGKLESDILDIIKKFSKS